MDNIALSFKVDERPILRKKVVSSFTIGEIRKINQIEDVGVAEINFEDISHAMSSPTLLF